MLGKWVTKALGKAPPIDDLGDFHIETVTLLVQGKNSFGDDVYSYIKMPIENVEELKSHLAEGKHFMPAHFGTVLAAGRGKPTQEVKEAVGQTEYMVFFEPTRLPNARPSA